MFAISLYVPDPAAELGQSKHDAVFSAGNSNGQEHRGV
jgi:hypothetical protein